MNEKPIAWSIAGSDCSGGAGIQADNQVFHAHGIHACNIVTANTAQNSSGVESLGLVTADNIRCQWQALQHEFEPTVVKLGMLANTETIDVIAQRIRTINCPVVCDPVLSASAGGNLTDSADSYHRLLPFIDLLTPNSDEFSRLFASFMPPSLTEEGLIQAITHAAKYYNIDIIVTGGDTYYSGNSDVCSDICIIDGELFYLQSKRMTQKEHLKEDTHGTGCSFSAAIAANLALGYDKKDAVVLAKKYMNQGFVSEACYRNNLGAFPHKHTVNTIEVLPHVSQLAAACTSTADSFPRMDTLKLGTYPVVDSMEWLSRCLHAGIKILQLRVKEVEPSTLDSMVASAVDLAKQFDARLFINDYWQLAIKYKAYGVHLGQEDLGAADLLALRKANIKLGISTHSWWELSRAHALRPSYIAIGPIYATTTKQMSFAPKGLSKLKTGVDLIGDAYPLVAIGGIDLTNAEEVLATGVGSVAMVRAITEADDYKAAIRAFQALEY